MDELVYLNNIPSGVERPALFHEDLSGGNILYSYPDRFRRCIYRTTLERHGWSHVPHGQGGGY